jgi:galactokinase
VNLIGDHTDYQDGLCVPMAIDREVRAEFAPRDDGRVVVRSSAVPGVVDVAADGSDDPMEVEPEWGRLVAGVVNALAQRERAPVGLDADITSTIPVGSGLSSSAAFAVALSLAGATVADLDLHGRALAFAAQQAEHDATGVPCGVMDQIASVSGKAGHALVLDCRDLTVDPIPIPRDAAIVVAHSGVPRRLEESGYAARRAACEAAAERIGVATLRDATFAQVADDPLARHVVSENARVEAFVDALRIGDLREAGALMLESHASLRDDFRVSTPELNSLVDLAIAHGAYGARLTGAGFGGCVVALASVDACDAMAAALASQYLAFLVAAADGAALFTE